MANQWFRMYHEFATDPKVQMLSEVDQRRYIMLLCLRCRNGDETLHETLHETEVAFQLRISDEEWTVTKNVLIDKGLITEGNEPTGWDDRQFVSDSSSKRVKAYRERQKTKEKRYSNVTVTTQDSDSDSDTERKKRKIKEKKVVPRHPDVDPKLWDEYIRTRARVKATNSDYAINRLIGHINKLVEAGHVAQDLVEEANMRGWKSVYPPKEDHQNGNHQRKSKAPSSEELLNHTGWLLDGENSEPIVRNSPGDVSRVPEGPGPGPAEATMGITVEGELSGEDPGSAEVVP